MPRVIVTANIEDAAKWETVRIFPLDRDFDPR